MRRCAALLLILLMLVPVPGAAAQGAGEGAIVFEPTPRLSIFRSKHYRIYTTLSRTETQPYGRHMDALHEQYVRRFRGLGERQIEPMALYLFESERQYRRFLAEHDIDGAHSGGMFFVTHRVEGLATWVSGRSRQKTYEVLQHEGFHQFAWHAFGPRLPVWLNEGLAQYFEDAVLAQGRMSLGMANAARIRKVQAALKTGHAQSINELLSVSNRRWSGTLRRDPNHASLMYAQAWSLAYFLIHADEGAYRPALLDYLERLGRGDRPRDAELMAFGQNGFAQFDRDWKRFARQQQPDQLTEAAERLRFLGTGLRILAEQGQAMPEDLPALRSMLRDRGFRLRHTEMGLTRDLSADHDELYRYTRGDRADNSERDFVLLRPDRSGLPPRITAPGLRPEPTLVWYRDGDGGLVQEIVYE